MHLKVRRRGEVEPPSLIIISKRSQFSLVSFFQAASHKAWQSKSREAFYHPWTKEVLHYAMVILRDVRPLIFKNEMQLCLHLLQFGNKQLVAKIVDIIVQFYIQTMLASGIGAQNGSKCRGGSVLSHLPTHFIVSFEAVTCSIQRELSTTRFV